MLVFECQPVIYKSSCMFRKFWYELFQKGRSLKFCWEVICFVYAPTLTPNSVTSLPPPQPTITTTSAYSCSSLLNLLDRPQTPLLPHLFLPALHLLLRLLILLGMPPFSVVFLPLRAVKNIKWSIKHKQFASLAVFPQQGSWKFQEETDRQTDRLSLSRPPAESLTTDQKEKMGQASVLLALITQQSLNKATSAQLPILLLLLLLLSPFSVSSTTFSSVVHPPSHQWILKICILRALSWKNTKHTE